MSSREGVPVEEVLAYIEKAVGGDVNLQMQLLETMRQLAGHPTAPQEERALGEALSQVLVGKRDPDLSRLDPEAAAEVRALLDRL
jgi:hypothetical protein